MKDYDSSDETNVTKRKLPHWQQEGCVYFVTFRLADSIPENKLAVWNDSRGAWLRSHRLDPEMAFEDILKCLSDTLKKEYYRIFWKQYHEMLDACHGDCVLKDSENARTVAEAMRFFDGDRYRLADFVVMPNHVHVLVQPWKGYSLTEVLHSWKRFTARDINRRLGVSGQLWQHESYDHIVRNPEQLLRIQQYIQKNPKKLRDGDFLYEPSRTSL